MRLINKNQKIFEVYKSIEKVTRLGGVVSEYEKVGEITGSLQPYKENTNLKEYGINVLRSYKIHTKELVNMLDRLFLNGVYYEVKGVKKWSSYNVLIVEEVSDG